MFNVTGTEKVKEFEDNLNYLVQQEGPRATVMALNRLRARAKARATTKVWGKARYLPVMNSAGNPMRSGIKRIHIGRRIFSSKATKVRQFSNMTAYIKPIPAISLGANKKTGTIKVTRVTRKTSGKRARTQKSGLGGVRVGGRFLPNSFVQLAKGKPQILYRKQYKTWRPGHYGWNYPAGSRQNAARMPYDVVKFDLSKPFYGEFPKAVDYVIKHYADEEYARALGTRAGRRLGRL